MGVRTAFCLGFLLLQPMIAYAETPASIELTLDHAQLLKLPHGTSVIVLGNPKIADITSQANGFYVLTGRSFGSTNLIAQNDGGEIIASFVLRVLPNTDQSEITVQRGMTRETFLCQPRCVQADVATTPASGTSSTAPR